VFAIFSPDCSNKTHLQHVILVTVPRHVAAWQYRLLGAHTEHEIN